MVFDVYLVFGIVFELCVDILIFCLGGGGWGWGVEFLGVVVVEVIVWYSVSFDMYIGRLFVVFLFFGSFDWLVFIVSCFCVDDVLW